MPEKTFRCFPEDAALFRQVIKAWPELDATVRGLQAQGMFPGLRAVQITLQGDEKTLAKGLAALLPENPPSGPESAAPGPDAHGRGV